MDSYQWAILLGVLAATSLRIAFLAARVQRIEKMVEILPRGICREDNNEQH